MKRIYTRLGIVAQLFCALLFLVFRRKKAAEPQHILVIQMAKLGDMICTTPMFRAIKERYPKARLFVLGNTVNKKILAGNPNVDEYIVADKSFFKTVKTLSSARIDIVFMTIPSFELLAACMVARIPSIVVPRVRNGWSPIETYPYIFLSSFVATKDHYMGSYAPREYLKLLEELGINTTNTIKDIYFSEEARQKVKNFFVSEDVASQSARVIGILPGAGNEIKAWAPEKFADVIKMIATGESSTTFLLLGEKKDAERAEVIKKNVGISARIIDCIDKFSIDELIACISMLDMVIGVDTGPQYIAEALNIPTVDIVGPCDENEQPPMGEIHRIVKVERDKPQLFLMNARVYDEKEAKRQSEEITPAMVLKEYEILRDSIKNKYPKSIKE